MTTKEAIAAAADEVAEFYAMKYADNTWDKDVTRVVAIITSHLTGAAAEPITHTSWRCPKCNWFKVQSVPCELRRENRDLKKYLRNIATVVTQSIAVLDAEMKKPATAERGKVIAAVGNVLEHANDSMMHFGLKIDFPRMNKLKKQWEPIKARRTSSNG